MQRIADVDNGSRVDGACITIPLPCGCRLTFRTPSRKTLYQGLLLDPHPASKEAMDPSCSPNDNFHPKWVEVRISRPVSMSQWFSPTVITGLVSCLLIICFVQSFIAQLTCLLAILLGAFLWFKRILVETSLLVCADFGLQTHHRFLTGHQSAGSFVPMNRLRGVHLVERLTPVTIQCYVAAELSTAHRPGQTVAPHDLPDSMLDKGRLLLPLLPSCLTANQLNSVNRLCVPFPTLIFVLRLVNAVCYPASKHLQPA